MNAFVKVLAVLFALLLILPGLCTVFFGGTFALSSNAGHDMYGFGQLGVGMLFGGAILVALGVLLVWGVFWR